ncbi:hypothetical protein [Arthrobacter sp. UYEF36]|uniref:hypothetical protein n=1 Tax=Arthrobacter sp. UYEF36 TaxID=1756366 RepID=UPI003394551E
MSARSVKSAGMFRAAPGSRDRRRLAFVVIALLALGGCSSDPPAGGPTTAAGSPSSGTAPPAGTPDKVYTDQELMAIINAVAQNRQVQGGALDSQRLRSGVAAGAEPLPTTETTPGDCVVFAPRSPFAVWADKSVNMAEGGIPIAAQSGPTTTITLTIRSAEKDAISQADFNYTDDLAARCGQFDLAYTESGRTSTHAVQLLGAPPAGERRFAWMQNTKPRQPGDFGSAGLRVLAGTLSVSLTLSVAELNSEADARPALDSMAGLAQEIIDQAVQHPPSVAAAPPNSRTPDDLVALLKGITGPNGNTVEMPSATVIGSERPGVDPGSPSQGPQAPCTYSVFPSFLPGSTVGQGQIQGSNKMDSITLTVASMPTTATQPYPFDAVAATLRDCATIQEGTGGSTRPWSDLKRPSVDIAADSSYAVVYQLSDGSGERHVMVGARKGTLTVEASVIRFTDAEVQSGADGLAAMIGQVFARAGL